MYWLIYLPEAEILYKFDYNIKIEHYTFYRLKGGNLNWTAGNPSRLPWQDGIIKIYKPHHLCLTKVKDV